MFQALNVSRARHVGIRALQLSSVPSSSSSDWNSSLWDDGTLSRGALSSAVLRHEQEEEEKVMGRYALLWLLGVPIPTLLLIWAFGGLH